MSAFIDKLLHHAKTQPDAVAVSCGQENLTWQRVASDVLAVAASLQQAGVAPGDRVAMIGGNSADYLAVFMGIVAAGGSAVTLPLMASPAALLTMVDDCGASLLLASGDGHAMARPLVADRPHVRLISFADLARNGTKTPVPDLPDLSPDAEFNIVYSSGTTGVPKGILHSHRTREALAVSLANFGFDHQAATLISTPLYTNLSLPAFLTTLWAGGRTLVMPKFDAGEFLALAGRTRATHFFLVPTQLERLLQHPDFTHTDLSASRLKYVAGSLLSPHIKEMALRLWPGRFVEVYGMTEGAPATALFLDEYPQKAATVGQVLTGGEIKIIGDEDQELAIGEVGEVVGRSSAMMLGYNNQPALTQALIWRDDQGREFFRSGDLGKLDEDGFLTIVGRKKDMIVSGGLNIYPADIEEVLSQHPGVAEVAVIAVPSATWGESPLALVVPKAEAMVDPMALYTWANQRLGKHQRIAAVELRTHLPRNALGKVLKQELRAPYWTNRQGAL